MNNTSITATAADKHNIIPPRGDIASSPLIPVAHLPAEGDIVYCSKGRIRLEQKLAAGGEGTVYSTNISSFVCKIYHKEMINRERRDKLSLMISKSLNRKGICWPREIVWNRDKDFVGYVMPEARGHQLHACVFGRKKLGRHFPDWTKKDTVRLSLSILETIQYLHQRNIIIGDINAQNILVVSPEEVCFVDTDSYQLEGFACPVGKSPFVAPELQSPTYSSGLRSFGNEYYAVATLLFMIMLPGKAPYAQIDGGSPEENVAGMDFSYPLGRESNKKAPRGDWRYIWSHLPYFLKEAFYKTFQQGGEYNLEHQRLSVRDWQNKMAAYARLLDDNTLLNRDSMAADIFPSRLKKHPGRNYVTCSLCQREVDQEFTEQGICLECLQEGEAYPCKRCGQPVIYTNRMKIRQARAYVYCRSCSEERRQVHSRHQCQSCGGVFDFTVGEFEDYAARGYNYPRRCKGCRTSHSNAASMAWPAAAPMARTPNWPGNGGGWLAALIRWFTC